MPKDVRSRAYRQHPVAVGIVMSPQYPGEHLADLRDVCPIRCKHTQTMLKYNLMLCGILLASRKYMLRALEHVGNHFKTSWAWTHSHPKAFWVKNSHKNWKSPPGGAWELAAKRLQHSIVTHRVFRCKKYPISYVCSPYSMIYVRL